MKDKQSDRSGNVEVECGINGASRGGCEPSRYGDLKIKQGMRVWHNF